jgi:hypothetical protein
MKDNNFDLQVDGAHLEDELTSELAHLRQRVSQVEMINQARRRDLSLLTRHVNRSLPWSELSFLFLGSCLVLERTVCLLCLLFSDSLVWRSDNIRNI